MVCIWITGLSGAGKTTLAKAVVEQLSECGSLQPVLLDGDLMRAALGDLVPDDPYAPSSRLRLAMFYSRLCAEFVDQGLCPVMATISLFHSVQEWNRENIPGYYEVLLLGPGAQVEGSPARSLTTDPAQCHNRMPQESIVKCEMALEYPLRPDLMLTRSPTHSPSDLARSLISGFASSCGRPKARDGNSKARDGNSK